MPDMTGKVTIITGGSGGIGAAAGRLFCEAGGKVMLVDLNEDALKTAAAAAGDNAAYCAADVTDAAQVKNYISATIEKFGGVDATLLNAGIEGTMAPLVDQTDADFDKVMAVNVKGVWLGLKHTMPEIEKRGGGSIVITSSTAGIRALGGITPYTCSKHAVIGLMRGAAVEGAASNIRVNTVNPSPIETRMIHAIEDAYKMDASGSNQPMAGGTPLKRYGQPEEVAKLMLFLASNDSSFCTGGVYMVDGGVSAGRSMQ
jgi:NAD(P)-dependent dehydrogenase (short-subunit alcohol dehydrogenase family)